MPIRWSAVSVSEAMDKVDKEIESIFEPLWRAAKIVRDAKEIPDLPDYMKHSLNGALSEIERITGVNLEKYGSSLTNAIARVRSDIPEGAIEAEKQTTRHGKTGSFL
jgi:hypothetical protein